ncbi:MAG TPA: hypothetical protein VHA70_06630 [Bauldia sp.]|nr:hypothetical protein [Bauldia sp.]
MAGGAAIAVIDIGKSNAKVALVDRETLAVTGIRTMVNTVIQARPYPHYDVERLWQWLLASLGEFAREREIEAISVTTHGACFVLLGGDGLALPVLDYEYDGPESLRVEYTKARGPFSETLSPDLPNGLNAGRQLYWLCRAFPEAYATADALLPYPQYWAWRLSGARAAETTSIGCHTDMWNPREAIYSDLARSEGWDRLMAPLVRPWDTIGRILPAVSAATGLPPNCRVVAGIHDSNASLLPHLLARRTPFAVLSTGTWMVALAPGGSLDGLDQRRDCLANVDAFGHAVPSTRFMAGREYELLAGTATATEKAAERVIADHTMVLPTFAPGTGPYGNQTGRWLSRDGVMDPTPLAVAERAAAASLYATLVTEKCLELAGADGPVIVEGPLARNTLFLRALAQRVDRPVLARPDATGTTEGAALLALGADAKPAHGDDPEPAMPLDIDLGAYARVWRQQAGA